VPSKKRRRSKLRLLLLWILTPLVIWVAAFVLWFRWPDLTAMVRRAESAPENSAAPARDLEQRGKTETSRGASRETIFEEDRKKLNELLQSKDSISN
jgi:hypothetical protein